MTSHEDLDPDGSGVNIENDSSGSKSTRANKGRVYLDKLAVLRAKGIKKDVSFNDRRQPIGVAGAEMQSYIGVLTRQYIKVSYKHLNDVHIEAKNFIWDNVTLTFNVDDRWKKDACNRQIQNGVNGKQIYTTNMLCHFRVRPICYTTLHLLVEFLKKIGRLLLLVVCLRNFRK